MNRDTIIRTAILAIALVNQILAACGKAVIPINDEDLTQLISVTFTIVSAVWAWWKNNSFTSAAIEADKFLKELKTKSKPEV